MKQKLPFKFSLRQLLYDRKFTIPVSLILAFFLWLVIVTNQNPVITRTFTGLPVTINLDNTPVKEEGMSIIGDLSKQKFTLTVSGPNYVVNALRAEDLNVFASAASINAPGEYSLEVTGARASARTDYDILEVSPAAVKVTVDYIESKKIPLSAQVDGVSAAEGLIAEEGVVSGAEGDTITVNGPRTVLNRIESAVAYTQVNKVLSASQTYDAEILLYDENGKEVSQEYLTLGTTDIKVTVPISKRVTVPVKADFTKLPAGFSKDSISYSVDHPTVTVIGTPEAIDKITQVTLSAIDITAVSTTGNSFDVSAKLPTGVRLLDNIEHFTVLIDTSNYAEKTFEITNVKRKGLSSSLTSSVSSSIKNVKICGPKAVIAGLKANALYAEIDLTNKTAGEHSVAAEIKSDQYKNIWQVGTYNTTVIIK